MSLSTAVKNGIQRASHVSGLSALVTTRSHVSRIVMYHGIGGGEITARAFGQHLRYLSQKYRIVSLGSLLKRIDNDEPMQGKEVALTFDDGLKNNFTVAYPMLKQLNIPATFFVCPGLVSDQKWIWTHEFRQRLVHISNAGKSDLLKELLAEYNYSLSENYVEDVVRWVKTLPIKKRNLIENAVADVSKSFSPTKNQNEEYDIASWDDIKSVNPDIISIGSHTLRHPILTSLGNEELNQEIHGSKQILEEKLQRSVDSFCYPNGTNSPEIVEKVRSHYKVAVTTEYGFVHSNDDLAQLKRVPSKSKLYQFSWRLVKPK